jgi:hypothetical protein
MEKFNTVNQPHLKKIKKIKQKLNKCIIEV